MKAIRCVSIFALSVGIATPALAQDTDTAASQAGLEEIIVTATRRAENLQDVPVSISAISSGDLVKKGVFETSDLNNSMPNLQVSSPYGKSQPNFSIRGIGVGTEFNANAASPVGVYVDEVYQTFRSSHGQQLYDLERIEIVRGPQGTLYGRNTTGGAINFITRKPELHGTNGYLTVGYGNYDRRSVEGAIELTPVEDQVGIRIAGTFEDSDPYMHNVNPNAVTDPGGSKNYGIRGTLRIKPSDSIDLSLKGYAAKSKGGQEVPISTGPSLTDDTVDLRNSILGGLYGVGLDALLPPPYSRTADGLSDKQVNADTAGYNINRAEGVVFSAKVGLADTIDLISTTGYDSGLYSQSPTTDCDGTPYRVCSQGYRASFNAFNQDLRLDITANRAKVILGAYYGRDVIKTRNRPSFFGFLSDLRDGLGLPATYFNPGGAFNGTLLPADSPPTGITATQNFKQVRKSAAIYGEGSYELTDTLKATIGLRYTKDKFAYTDALTTYYDDAGNARMYTVSNYAPGGVEQAYIIGVSPGPAPEGLERRAKSSQLTGRAIIDWKPIDGVMLFASYSKGYRGGTYNGLSYGSAAQVYFVKPEKVDAFEGGFKTRFLDNRAQLNGSFFYYRYKGQQGQVVDQTATANLVSLDGSMKGLEIEAEFAATETLRLSASLGLLDSKYKRGACPAAPLVGYPPQAGNCVSTGAGNVDVGGNPFPYAAKSSINLAFDWDVATINEGKITLHGDANYTGQFYYDSFGKYDYVNGDVNSRDLARGVFHEGEGKYWVVNGRLSYATDSWTLSGWVKNLTDKTYYPFGINLETLFGSGYRVRSQPRTYGIEASVRF
jgi:iron complex outermembrane receptor protein